MGTASGVFATTTGEPGLGYGLNGISDWTTQQPFLDVMKTARPWTGHEDGQWGAMSYEDMQALGLLDENGYLTAMPDGITRVETFVLTEITEEATYTAGRYRLTYEGEGEVQVFGGTNVVAQDGEIWFDYTPSSEGLVAISISSTDPNGTGDYLRDFSLVKDEHIDAYDAGQMFNPLFIANIENAHALRFMDWMDTNNSDLTEWADRPDVGDFTYANGVPVEVMVALANETGTEPWFNIPHNADDDYIREFASYVAENLDPDLRAHYEFSNEVWNFMFDQARDSAFDAQERFGTDLGDGWMQEYGARSAEMASILDEVYTGREGDYVKVIATHTAWPGLEQSALEAPAYQALSVDNVAPFTLFDTYAVTGYFGGTLGGSKAEDVLDWIAESRALAEQDADALGLTGQARADYIAAHQFDHATDLALQELRDGSVTGDPEGSLQELDALFAYHSQVAESYGLDMVMYEGGTHIVGLGEYTSNQDLTAFFVHLNYSDEMGVLYEELLDSWVENGGTLFNAFVDVARPSQFGSWGTLRHLEDSTPRDDVLDTFQDTYPRLDVVGEQPDDPVVDDVDPIDPVEDPSPEPEPEPDPEPSPDPDPTPDPDPVTDPEPETPPEEPEEEVPNVRGIFHGSGVGLWRDRLLGLLSSDEGNQTSNRTTTDQAESSADDDTPIVEATSSGSGGFLGLRFFGGGGTRPRVREAEQEPDETQETTNAAPQNTEQEQATVFPRNGIFSHLMFKSSGAASFDTTADEDQEDADDQQTDKSAKLDFESFSFF